MMVAVRIRNLLFDSLFVLHTKHQTVKTETEPKIAFFKKKNQNRTENRIFFKTEPKSSRSHGNKIWDKMGYNSASARDISKIFASNWGFWGGAIG